jgi:hypothetical protein
MTADPIVRYKNVRYENSLKGTRCCSAGPDIAVAAFDFAGNKMPMNIHDKAPEFTLQDENGKEVSLKDLRGKVVVLYFYPRADTPGCTVEACAFRYLQADSENGRRAARHFPRHP